jgi:hypothetical protein
MAVDEGAAMRIGRREWLLLAAAIPVGLLAGCGDFWQAPNTSGTTGFALTNSGNITVTPGATTGNTSTITVTPGSSFTSGTVSLTCAVTTSLSSPTSPVTCAMDAASLTFSSTTAQTSTFTATTTSTTTLGAYNITVTGVSGSVAAKTSFCVEVGTGACATAATSSGSFYILSSNAIYGFSISSGTLTALSGSPTSLPSTAGAAQAMAIDPTGKFLYVATAGDGILLYKTGSGGALTLDTNGTISDSFSFALQVDSSGHWLLDASDTAGQPTLYAWPISTTTGEPTLGSGINAPGRLLASGGNVTYGGMAISPDNKLVSVAVGSETDTFGFTAGTDFTGATNPLSSSHNYRTAIGTAISVAFDPNTSFLYIGETGVYGSSNSDSGGLRIIPISSDNLGTEPAVTSTYPYPSGGNGPHAILADSNGYVYVANSVGTGNGNITGFLLDASTPSAPTLTVQTNSATTGEDPLAMALDSTGGFVFVVNNLGSSPLDAYTFDANTAGGLDPFTITGTVGASPVAIVALPK